MMTRRNVKWTAVAITTLVLVTASKEQIEGVIADRDLGLSKSSVFEVPAPPLVSDNSAEPGEEPVREPAYPGAPPQIPHGIGDFLPISLEENQCVDCHMVEEKIEGEPTPIPESHFRDLRRNPETVLETLAGARTVCTTCHVPVTGAQPAVGNTFQ